MAVGVKLVWVFLQRRSVSQVALCGVGIPYTEKRIITN